MFLCKLVLFLYFSAICPEVPILKSTNFRIQKEAQRRRMGIRYRDTVVMYALSLSSHYLCLIYLNSFTVFYSVYCFMPV